MKLAKKGARARRVPEAIQSRWDNEMCTGALPLDHCDRIRSDMVREFPQMREVFQTLLGIDVAPSAADTPRRR